jgi:hypothetical protein
MTLTFDTIPSKTPWLEGNPSGSVLIAQLLAAITITFGMCDHHVLLIPHLCSSIPFNDVFQIYGPHFGGRKGLHLVPLLESLFVGIKI